MPKACFSLVFLASLAYAQLDSDTVTVTAVRNRVLPQDQVIFLVDINLDVSVTLDEVLEALPGTGITAADLSYVAPWQPYGTETSHTEWVFTPQVPLAKLTSMFDALDRAHSRIAKSDTGTNLYYYVQTTQASSAAAAAQTCSMPTLVSDARSMAQKLAEGAGAKLGGVVALSQPSFYQGGFAGTPALKTGQWFGVGVLRPAGMSAVTSVQVPGCGLTVQFQMLR